MLPPEEKPVYGVVSFFTLSQFFVLSFNVQWRELTRWCGWIFQKRSFICHFFVRKIESKNCERISWMKSSRVCYPRVFQQKCVSLLSPVIQPIKTKSMENGRRESFSFFGFLHLGWLVRSSRSRISPASSMPKEQKEICIRWVLYFMCECADGCSCPPLKAN